MTDRSCNVLFVGTDNSARSILAEAIMNRVGNGKLHGFSARTRPRGALHPLALEMLRRKGLGAAFARSKSRDEFKGPDAPKMDFVSTVIDTAAAEGRPVWPGQPVTAHWGMPDPVVVEGTEAEKALAFAETFRARTPRIQAFAALTFATLDPMALQARLSDIGQQA